MIDSNVKAVDLTVGYGETPILEKLTFEAHPRQLIGLLGPNGVGKSTVLRCLAGFLAPKGGVVYIGDKEINKIQKKELARELSVVLTDRNFGEFLTVFELVAIGRHPYTNMLGSLSNADAKLIWDSLTLVGASHLAHRYFNELSDGEKQKVMIARAIAQTPKVMILDEPTSFLDVKSRIEIMQILKHLTRTKDITVIVSTHDVDLAFKLCDYLILIGKRNIIKAGPPEEILNGNTIQEVYNLNRIGFNHNLFIIEPLAPDGKPFVHVVSGAATGIPLFRIFAKSDIPFSAGILHENDVDYHVACAMNAEIISEKPYNQITSETFDKAMRFIHHHDIRFIVDAGFNIGEINRDNIRLLEQMLSKDRIVISLRQKSQVEAVFNDPYKIICCSNAYEVLDFLKSYF